MTEAEIIQVPLVALIGLLVVIGGCSLLAIKLLKLTFSGQAYVPQQERDWSVPVLDAAADGNSLFHCWDVRFKLVALLGFAFFIVATSSPWSALIALMIAFAAVLVAQLPLVRAARRLMAMGGFLTMFLVILPVTVATRADDILLVFSGLDFFSVNLRGLQLALAIIGKACAVALLMEPLLATASLPRTIEGLTRLGVPEKVGQMILLAHRYIFVFLDEARRMAVGMQVRGFRRRTNIETLQVMGNFLGMLFVRSFERTQRVYEAMQSRGYQGRFPAPAYFVVRRSDWLHCGFWLLLGILLLVFDRFAMGGG